MSKSKYMKNLVEHSWRVLMESTPGEHTIKEPEEARSSVLKFGTKNRFKKRGSRYGSME